MVRNVSAQGRQLPTRHLRPPQPPPASLGSASNAAAAAGDDTRAELLRTQAEIEELRALVGSAALAPGDALGSPLDDWLRKPETLRGVLEQLWQDPRVLLLSKSIRICPMYLSQIFLMYQSMYLK